MRAGLENREMLAKFGVRSAQAGKARENSAQPLLSHFPGGCCSVGVGYPVESCGKLPGGHLLPASPHRNAAPLDAVLSHPELLCPAGTGCPVPGRVSCPGTGRLPRPRPAQDHPGQLCSPGNGPGPWQQVGQQPWLRS